jgi:hypothetical protein
VTHSQPTTNVDMRQGFRFVGRTAISFRSSLRCDVAPDRKNVSVNALWQARHPQRKVVGGS